MHRIGYVYIEKRKKNRGIKHCETVGLFDYHRYKLRFHSAVYDDYKTYELAVQCIIKSWY